MDDDKIGAILDQMGQAAYELAAYCHAEGCEDVWDCPEHKEECSRKLGPDTAIAWEMAALLYHTCGLLHRGASRDWKAVNYSFHIGSAIYRIAFRLEKEFPKLFELVAAGYELLVEADLRKGGK